MAVVDYPEHSWCALNQHLKMLINHQVNIFGMFHILLEYDQL